MRKQTKALASVVGIMAGFAAAMVVHGAESFDWPQFRGPDRNGISRETQWNPKSLGAEPKILWRAEVGEGYSDLSIQEGRAFTAGNKDGQDTIYALSTKDGKVLWQHSYKCAGGSYPGPRATPVTDGKVVYTLSREGLLLCLDAASGAVKWEKLLVPDLAKNLTWGFAGSPVIKGDKLLVNAGEYGIVLNRHTGEKIWSSPGGVGGYATPVVFEAGGKECLALFSAKAVYGVELATGKKLWSHDWETRYDVNAADPIVQDGRVFVSSGYGKGGGVLDFRGPEPKTVWFNTSMKNHFSSCVLIDGFLYGFDGNAGNGALKCIEFATGAVKWSENIGFGSLTAAGEYLIALNESGDLFIVKISPTGYNLVSTAKKVLGKTCWTSPVLSHGIIFCRNSKGSIVAVDVSK